MKVMVLSDSHGLVREVVELVEHFKVDRIIHCGDFCVEATTPPFATMLKVRGNCDFAIDVPLKKTLEWQGLRAIVVHGHKYRVKESYLQLSYLAEEEKAHIVLFGHSHLPASFIEKGTLFLNPGSIYRPRGYPTPTFVIADLEKLDDGFLVKVDYYNLEYKKMTDLSGEYKLERK